MSTKTLINVFFILYSMATIKLRPHHVSSIIGIYQRYINLKDALQSSGSYSTATVSRTTEFVESLLSDLSQQVEIIGSDEVGEDSICALCDNNSSGICTLGSGKIQAHNSADQREALNYGLEPGVYIIGELLERKPAISPIFVI